MSWQPSARRIKKLRRDLEMTQVQLGRVLGLHFMTISKWERGVACPTAYQRVLLRSFTAALKNAPHIGRLAALHLDDAGVSRALYVLLREAHRGE